MTISREMVADRQQRLINVFLGNSRENSVSPVGSSIMEDWDWFQGVALFGLYQYTQKTGDERVRQYLLRWFDHHFQQGLPAKNVNSVCPMLTLSFLYEETKNEAYRPYLDEWLAYAMNDLPRTECGGFQHKTRDAENEQQLWDDTLYMTVLFIARQGKLLNDERLIEESIRQYQLHIQYLTDPESGLFFHGWTFDGRHHFANALWGRGNAWFTAGLVDYLDIAPIPEETKSFLLDTLKRQTAALLPLQDEEGMWHTLLTEPETSYAESSATAGFAYGLLKSVRLGYLDREIYLQPALKAASAILKRIGEDGVLTQTSGGTCVGDTLDYYRSIPLGVQPYGQSMALLMLVELENHLPEARQA